MINSDKSDDALKICLQGKEGFLCPIRLQIVKFPGQKSFLDISPSSTDDVICINLGNSLRECTCGYFYLKLFDFKGCLHLRLLRSFNGNQSSGPLLRAPGFTLAG